MALPALLGEGCTIGAPMAIANALADAPSPLGADVFELPMTSERLFLYCKTRGRFSDFIEGTDVEALRARPVRIWARSRSRRSSWKRGWIAAKIIGDEFARDKRPELSPANFPRQQVRGSGSSRDLYGADVCQELMRC